MPPLTSGTSPEEARRKRRRLMANAMVGPAALALLLLARRVEPLREVIDDNAGIRFAALATMVMLVLYSAVFQLKLTRQVVDRATRFTESLHGPRRY